MYIFAGRCPVERYDIDEPPMIHSRGTVLTVQSEFATSLKKTAGANGVRVCSKNTGHSRSMQERVK